MKSRPFFLLLVLMLAAVLACGCGPAAATTPGVSTATVTARPPATPRPTRTPIPTPTLIPGYEDWSVISPYAVEIQTDGQAVTMTLKHKALWFMNQRGVLLYRPVTGDFKITADVHTSKSSDTSQPPGGDGTVQLGGVMLRSDAGASENYVFIVIGDDGDGLSVETKNTVNNLSKYDGPAWDAAGAQLRLCRVGSTLSAYKRHASSDERWIQAASFDRPDLPETLQAGLNIYTDSAPDLQVRYDHIEIAEVAGEADCVK